MSEYVSYSVSAHGGGAVRQALRNRGIFFHDDAAWQTAEERAEALRRNLRQALDAMGRNSALTVGCHEEPHLEVSRLSSMLEAFCRVPAFKGVAEQAHSEEFGRLREEIEGLSDAGIKSEPGRGLLDAVNRAQRGLEAFAASVQRELCAAEKEAVLNTTASTLSDLGYLVEGKGDNLKATCNQMNVWARAGEHGELAVDFSGLSGLSCMKEMARIEEHLGRHGVHLRRTASAPHGRPEGGVLVKSLRPLFPEFRKIEGKRKPVRLGSSINQGKERTRS